MAAPVLSAVPSVTSGRAPLAVTLNCAGTTGVTIHNGYWQHSFGDAGAGTWDNGANTSQSKNFATGIVAAHIYETPGTYYITSLCGNSAGEYDVEINTITVTDWPDDANTVCVGNTLPDAGVNGVPSNATCLAYNDFDAAISDNIGTNKRILFNNADTFASSTAAVLTTTGPAMIGGYGVGSGYSITSTNISGVIRLSTGATDIRIEGPVITGSGASDTGAAITVEAASVSKIAILNPVISAIGKGIIVTGANSLITSVIQGADITDIHAASGGVGIFGQMTDCGIIGNSVGPFATTAEHNIRLQPAQRCAITNNTATTPGTSGKQVFALRAGTHATTAEDSFSNWISDNKFTAGAGNVEMWQIGPSANSSDERIYDCVAERNWCIGGSSSTKLLYLEADRITVRNNIFNVSANPGASCAGIYHTNVAGVPTPTANAFINNTCYSSGAIVAIDLGFGGADVIADTVVTNNVAYGASGSVLSEGAGVSGTVSSNNSATVTDNPQFVGPLTSPLGFTVSVASYAAAGGTASFPAQQSDFFNAFDKSGDNRIGAIVQNGEQQIKGVAA